MVTIATNKLGDVSSPRQHKALSLFSSLVRIHKCPIVRNAQKRNVIIMMAVDPDPVLVARAHYYEESGVGIVGVGDGCAKLRPAFVGQEKGTQYYLPRCLR